MYPLLVIWNFRLQPSRFKSGNTYTNSFALPGNALNNYNYNKMKKKKESKSVKLYTHLCCCQVYDDVNFVFSSNVIDFCVFIHV